MMISIPRSHLHVAQLSTVLDLVHAIKDEGGSVSLSAILSVICFEPEAIVRLQAARGDVVLKRSNGKLWATNEGAAITEPIPGAVGLASLRLFARFKAEVRLSSGPNGRTLKLVELEGIEIDIPGPFDPDVHQIVISEPATVEIQI